MQQNANRNKSPIREKEQIPFGECVDMLYGRSSPIVRRLGRLIAIIGSLTAEACLVEGFCELDDG